MNSETITMKSEMTMTQPTNDQPIDAVYPIVPNGPAVFILNEYSSVYRVAITPPPSAPSEAPAPEEPPARAE
jgi:hypothetical protein